MKASAWAAVLPRTATVEIAVAHGNGTGPTIARQVSLPAGDNPFVVARQQIDPRAHRIVTAVSGDDVWFHVLSLPTTDAKELTQMLELQMDTLTPLPLEEVVYGFESLGQTAEATKVLVAIANKAAVNERVAALEAAGLPPELVSVDTLASFRTCQRTGCLATDPRLNAFVQVTSTAGHIVVYSNGQPLSIRTVMFGAETVDVPARQQLLLAELQRTLITAQVEHAREPGKVAFATWDEQLRPDVEQLRAATGGGDLLEDAQGLAPVASVCLEAAGPTEPKLNLLPDEWRQKRRSSRYRRTLFQAGIGLAALYVLALIGFLVAMAVEQARVKAVTAKVTALRPSYSEARQLHGTLTAMKLQLDTKYSALEVLRETTRVLPEGVTLSGFAFKKDQSVTLRGQSGSAINANEFISRLEKSEFFSQVKTVSVRTERNLTKFELVCALRSSAPVAATAAANPPTRSTAWR